MLDLKYLVNHPEKVSESLRRRNYPDASEAVSKIVGLDERRKSTIQSVEALKAARNQATEQIAQSKKAGQDASALVEQMRSVSQKIKALDDELKSIEAELDGELLQLPNLISETIPTGTDATSNKIIREWGEKKRFSFKPKAHFEIGSAMDILDFDRAGKVTGARFVFLKGIAAKMERALAQFMLDTHSAHGYTEIFPPSIVSDVACIGTGQLPKFSEDIYKLQGTNFYLSPTAEVPVTNLYRDEILEETQLPIQYCAYSSCFRAEAGAAGRDTRGIKRQHQFQKVELVKFSGPDTSQSELEKLVLDAERILQALKLPYRVVVLCSGDIGFSAMFTYDLEVWSPYEEKFVEISSCSNCGDFQARRANIRYRRQSDGKVAFVHTLNGSGLAIGRTVLAIMENYQTSDGSFDIPECLKPYIRTV